MKKLLSLILVMAMVLSLCACGKADDYEAAIALMEAGNYEEAMAAFTELGDYEDSAQKLEECENILAYAEAVALFDAEQYEDALAIFSALGDYQDSLEKKAECENALAYQAALDMIDSGDYENAYTALVELGDYKDVPEMLTHFKEVEITPENWSEYFVVVEKPRYIKNDFGEITDILFFEYTLFLKEEISSRVFNAEQSNVIFEFTFDAIYKDVQFGITEGDYISSDSEYFRRHNFQDLTTLTYNHLSSENHFSLGYGKIEEAVGPGQEAPFAYCTCENFNATRAQGSIFVYE